MKYKIGYGDPSLFRDRKSDRTMMNHKGGWHSACRTCGLLWSQLLNHDSTRFLIAAR
jgi:hypothetical protein